MVNLGRSLTQMQRPSCGLVVVLLAAFFSQFGIWCHLHRNQQDMAAVMRTVQSLNAKLDQCANTHAANPPTLTSHQSAALPKPEGPTVCSFGSVRWDDTAFLRTEVASFSAAFHAQRERFPKANDGGNGEHHSFAIWVVVRQLRPKLIVESGILNGQTSWLIHHATREWDPVLVRIDPTDHKGHWVDTSPNSRFVDLIGDKFVDFGSVQWDTIAPGVDLTDGLAFFDDHMDQLERLKQARAAGFRHALMDDNYVAGFGDLFSIKNACDGGQGDSGIGASGGEVRRTFTRPNKMPKRCTKFHKKCRDLNNDGAVAARKELLEIAEVIWEAPPLTPVGAADEHQYAQLKRIGNWAEGRAPKSEQDMEMLLSITKAPLFSTDEEAATQLNMPALKLHSSRGWYMHMAYIQIKALT